jgi:PilZ domain
VERRLDARWTADLGATVTNLATGELPLPARIMDISKSGLRIQGPLQLAPWATVKVTIADCTLFGSVVHTREDNGTCEVGIEILRVLWGESDVAQLINAFLTESPAEHQEAAISEPNV